MVAGRDEPPIASLDDLSGREVHVRRSSGYYEDLTRLNERLRLARRAPVTIVDVDEALEDEDILQMVDAGIVPVTITNTLYASFWRQVYDRLHVYDGLEVRRDGAIAWAVRREARQLLGAINEFVDSHKVGTVFGNLLIKRYLGSAARLHNPGAAEDLRRFRATARHLPEVQPAVPVRLAGHRRAGLSGVAHRPEPEGRGRSGRGHADHAGHRRRRRDSGTSRPSTTTCTRG